MESKESKNEKKAGKKSKWLTYLLVGLVTLQVLFLVATMLASRGRGSRSENDGSFLFPFWLVIFIPIIATRRKKQTSGEEKTRWLWLMVGLAVLVLLGMIVFLLKALS